MAGIKTSLVVGLMRSGYGNGRGEFKERSKHKAQASLCGEAGGDRR